MNPKPRARSIRALGFLLVLSLPHLVGCSSWRSISRLEQPPITPSAVDADTAPNRRVSLPSEVRLRLVSGETVMMRDPSFDGDSLRGRATRTSGSRELGPTAIARKDILRIEVSRFDTGETIGLVVGLAALAFGGLLVGYSIIESSY